jgi:hypothetical protein
MNYTKRLARASGVVFVIISLCGLVVTLNGATSIIATALISVAIAAFCVRRT